MSSKKVLSGRYSVILCVLRMLIFFLPFTFLAQKDSTIELTFDFNDHKIKEIDGKVMPKPFGVTLTYDRFGNQEAAVQVMGHKRSYLNLGISKLFRSPNISISMWVNVNAPVYTGTGNQVVPLLIHKNGPGQDFVNALALGYDLHLHRLSANSTKDSLEEVVIFNNDSLTYNKWYHLVLVCNNTYFAFYVDGILVGSVPKNFETKFLETDSLVVGHSSTVKNERYLRGVVDDIKIFHRTLTSADVQELYNAPNPNEFSDTLDEVMKYLVIIFVFIIIIIILIVRNRRKLRKQKQELELATKIAELELRAIKSKMNPHFISNSLSAIQELNYNHDVEKAGLYIAKFSYFLRQILDYSDEDYISISEEIIMMRLFVELEQLRFKDGFNFELIVEDLFNTEEIMIPSLITQPFIENAIWHGLLPLRERAPKLTVRIFIQNGLPVVEIEDNGVGRDLNKNPKRKSKGTQLVIDKIDALNRLSKTSNYNITIIDLTNTAGDKQGTKIIINLDSIKE